MASHSEIHCNSIELCPNCGHTFQTRLQSAAALPSKLRENYVPLSAEKVTIQNLILVAELELQRCEAEISRLEHVLHNLNAEKSRIDTIIRENKSLLSPIRRLPAELLSDIFEFCLPVDKEIKRIFTELKGRSISLVPFAIATTCHLWRQIATDSPLLWSKIILDLDTTMSPGTTDILDVFLHRSANHSLHVYLKFVDNLPLDATSLILPNAFRISLLRLWGDRDPFLRSNLLFPRLKTFSFRSSAALADGDEPHLDPFPWLVSATQLHSVLLRDASMLPEFLQGIPNKHIQFLATYDLYTSQTFHILQRFSDTIKEGWIFVEEQGEEIEERIHLSSLETLTIHIPYVDDEDSGSESMPVIPCLTNLTSPSLLTLRVINDKVGPMIWDTAVFQAFISRSGLSNQLTKLDLRGEMHIEAEQLITSLELLPAITHLTLFGLPSHQLMSPTLLKRLTIDHIKLDNPSPILLPALTYLQIRLYDPDRLPLLVSFIKSRSPQAKQGGVAALGEVWVKLISATGKENVTDLAECRALGVRVHAEVLSKAERYAWLDSPATQWDSTLNLL